jgi:3-oxoadipate enol-lactonase
MMRHAPAYFDSTRGRLAYQTSGDGECVVFCHALGTDRTLWKDQVEALNTRFTSLAFDMRGHGQSSPALDMDYSFESMAADVISLLDHLGIGCASIVGISVGGEVAQWLAATYPGRVARLFLSSTACFTDRARAALWESRISEADTMGMEPMASSAASRWFSDGFRKSHPDIVEDWRRKIATTSVRAYAGIARAIQSMDLRQMIGAISCPTWIVCGEQDGNTGPAAASTIADCIPGARMHVIDSAGHLPNLEKPAEFNDHLLRWLSTET